MVHYILVDLNNNGELFRLGLIGDLEAILNHYESISQDVIFQKSKDEDKLRKKELKFRRVFDYGTLISCEYYCDKCQSKARSKIIRNVDRRKAVIK